MRCFDHDCDTLGIQFFNQQVSDFLGHPFLDLWPPGNHLDHAGQLAQPDHAAAGHVTNVCFAHERQQVMLAHAAKTNVPNQYNLVVLFLEELVRVLTRICMQPAEHPDTSRSTTR